jgi:hypothetical protein
MEDVRISTLRLESHRILPNRDEEHLLPEGGVFWRVFVDDEVITELAMPFFAVDRVIELEGNIQVPVWGHGSRIISVRGIGNYVIWTDLLEEDREYFLHRQPAFGRIMCFDADLYATIIQHTHADYRHHPLTTRGIDLSKLTLPQFSAKDLRRILTFPDTSYAIYRMPERDDDRWGKSYCAVL